MLSAAIVVTPLSGYFEQTSLPIFFSVDHKISSLKKVNTGLSILQFIMSFPELRSPKCSANNNLYFSLFEKLLHGFRRQGTLCTYGPPLLYILVLYGARYTVHYRAKVYVSKNFLD